MHATRPVAPRPVVRIALTGVAMGLAELVPGFSAGTVAYVAGIYTRFLGLIEAVLGLPLALARGQLKTGWAKVDLPFGLILVGAMFVTVFSAASGMRQLLDTAPQTMSAVFFGLVFGAVIAATRQLRPVVAREWPGVIVIAATVFMLLGFTGPRTQTPALWFVLLAGMIAISAWILPGVSGSFTLVVLGLYPVIVAALAERDVTVLAVFALGCLIGLASIVTLLTRLLARHGRAVRLVLIAVMLGSMRVLWPWSDTFASADLGAPESVGSFVGLMAVALFAAGAVVAIASRPAPEN
jgi:putative membrane protein